MKCCSAHCRDEHSPTAAAASSAAARWQGASEGSCTALGCVRLRWLEKTQTLAWGLLPARWEQGRARPAKRCPAGCAGGS